MKKLDPIKNKEVIIGIDIALNKSGLCVMDSDKNVYYTRLIDAKKKKSYYKKLDYLYNEFTRIFSIVKGKSPKKVTLIIEDRLKAGWSGATLASIEGARVTSYHAFTKLFKGSSIRSSVVLYDPGSVKKHFTGRRASKKDMVYKSAVQDNPFIKSFTQEDVLDAIYLVLYHIDK